MITVESYLNVMSLWGTTAMIIYFFWKMLEEHWSHVE